ncbi:glutamate-5-semialdehyde dehydrogenase [Candidatus Deianiraea vastatrix]|uniref:Gamma-glutamyl phosphate reductase n=1 Tax=Candidatus Deianiraea vastatrix TaxID=2163644 RepID=A0A5B8XE42_9RICK|nr:glutamate-5-semialdehyde dehydrogenase [Candidatus Deianiraea vastatrix]QED23582.1 Gamma-glutamyl phosphate reductase [Candidatus Deianiraea vastatrix]
MESIFKAALGAKKDIQNASFEQIFAILSDYSSEILDNCDAIITENAKDLAKMDKENPKYDRLLLNKERISSIASDVLKIAQSTFRCDKVLDEKTTSAGLEIKKIRTPLGIVGIIYESRPNVTADAISICIKTQNVCLLKGSDEADFSNAILVKIAKNILQKHGINTGCITLLPSSSDATLALITAQNIVDVCIPRGGKGLINFVRENAKVPVIETGAGVVHVYVDEGADVEIAKKTIANGKMRRVSVCNSVDCIVISHKMLDKIGEICKPMIEKNVEIFADSKAFAALSGFPNVKLASDEHFGTEFLSMKIAIKTTTSIEEAISHIEKFSSKHSEAIITQDEDRAAFFLKNVDAACVYHNTSTAFTDGGCFDMAAEIGISTQKLHARGPFALDELTTYKWIIKSDGATR